MKQERKSTIHRGFSTRDDPERGDRSASKAGDSEGMRKNLAGSSASISRSPSSTSTGEDDPEEIERRDDEIEQGEDPDEAYSSTSDELEMGRAALEAATQSPGSTYDPASAASEIEETDDIPPIESEISRKKKRT